MGAISATCMCLAFSNKKRPFSRWLDMDGRPVFPGRPFLVWYHVLATGIDLIDHFFLRGNEHVNLISGLWLMTVPVINVRCAQIVCAFGPLWGCKKRL